MIIETLPDHENRYGITIDKTSARTDAYGFLIVICEAKAISGSSIKQDIEIQCALYDENGFPVDSSSEYLSSEEFFQFQLIKFDFAEEGLSQLVRKIKIYPKMR